MKYPKFKRFCTVAASAFLLSTLTIHAPIDSNSFHLNLGSEVEARSSGGRSGGGSFRSSPSRSSSGNSSGSSRSYSSPSRSDERYNSGPTVIPVPVGPGIYSDPYRSGGSTSSSTNSDEDDGGWIVGLVILGIIGLGVLLFVGMVLKELYSSGKEGSGSGELYNDRVTISKIQVALLAQAREIQSDLTNLSMQIDSDTPEGLLQLMQESVLALLRMPENWSHVLSTSQTVSNREEAETIFSKLSIAERSKFSVETLTNVGGRVRKREDFRPDPEEDPAAYIVVTLLVGTAHDKPLYTEIRTEQALKDVLEMLASVSSDHLMVFELLWSPQSAADSLTYDELLTEYTDMIQI